MDILDQTSNNLLSQDYGQVNSFNSLSLVQKNEEYKYKILSLEKKLQTVTSELKQNENWKERFNEQKNQNLQLNQKIEDLQTRLQISLQSQSELEKKHQEAIEQINSQRLSEIIHMKTNFSQKEKEQNEIIQKLKEKIKSLKTEIIDYNKKIIDIERKSNLEKEQTPAPFSIQLTKNNDEEKEIKLKKRIKKEKEKNKQLKSLNFDQKNEIDKLEKEVDEKQKIITSLQLQQNETSTIIQSLQQKVDDLQIQSSLYLQENQKKIREESNNNMEIELASFFTEQNEIHNKKINSLSLKLSKAIQINNELNEKNERLIFMNTNLKEINKRISLLENDLNVALSENQEKDRIINKIIKKIKVLQSKNKILKKENSEYQRSQSFSQQNLNSTEIENNSQIIDKFFSFIDSHKSELNNMIHTNSQSIPLNLLPSELISSFSGNELKIERIIEWYNNEIRSLKIDSKQLKIMKNVISSCFTNIQFDFDNNKLFCEQARNAINSLKDQLRILTLKQQQMHVSSIDNNSK